MRSLQRGISGVLLGGLRPRRCGIWASSSLPRMRCAGDKLSLLGSNDHGPVVEDGLDAIPEWKFVSSAAYARAGGWVRVGVGGHGVHVVPVLMVCWDEVGVAEGRGVSGNAAGFKPGAKK